MNLKQFFFTKILLFTFYTFIYTQICNHQPFYKNETTISCSSNNYCDSITSICKCNHDYYGRSCEKKLDPFYSTNIKLGIKSSDFLIIILLPIIFWGLSFVIGMVTIYFCFYSKESLILIKKKEAQEIIIEVENENKNKSCLDQIPHIEKHLAKINFLEKQYEEIKIFISNFELEVKNLTIENQNLKNILDNIFNYFSYCKKPNEIILSNIFDEVEILLNLVKINKEEFFNIDYDRFKTQFIKIKREKYFDDNLNLKMNQSEVKLQMRDIDLFISHDSDISNEKGLDRIYKRVNHTENEDENENKNKFCNQMVLPSEQTGLNTHNSNYDSQNNDLTEENLVIKKTFQNYNKIPIPSPHASSKKSTLEKIKDKVSKIKSFDVKFKNKNSINLNTIGKKKTLSTIKSINDDDYKKLQTSNPSGIKDFNIIKINEQSYQDPEDSHSQIILKNKNMDKDSANISYTNSIK